MINKIFRSEADRPRLHIMYKNTYCDFRYHVGRFLKFVKT